MNRLWRRGKRAMRLLVATLPLVLTLALLVAFAVAIVVASIR